jgi:hypothetical protein
VQETRLRAIPGAIRNGSAHRMTVQEARLRAIIGSAASEPEDQAIAAQLFPSITQIPNHDRPK